MVMSLCYTEVEGAVAQWQSERLITAGSQVRILPAPPEYGGIE